MKLRTYVRTEILKFRETSSSYLVGIPFAIKDHFPLPCNFKPKRKDLRSSAVHLPCLRFFIDFFDFALRFEDLYLRLILFVFGSSTVVREVLAICDGLHLFFKGKRSLLLRNEEVVGLMVFSIWSIIVFAVVFFWSRVLIVAVWNDGTN